jgi:hypothetical protein
MKVRDVVNQLVDPIRRNNFEARRHKLGLSRVALGRILDVNPTTVFRHERGPFIALWDYALRGIEAEAASGKQVLRSFKAELDRQTFIPDQLDARGFSYTAERMQKARRQHAQQKSRSSKPTGKSPATRNDQNKVKQIADRAEARARAERDRHGRE